MGGTGGHVSRGLVVEQSGFRAQGECRIDELYWNYRCRELMTLICPARSHHLTAAGTRTCSHHLPLRWTMRLDGRRLVGGKEALQRVPGCEWYVSAFKMQVH